MKRLLPLLVLTTVMISSANAGELFAIKAFGKPGGMPFTTTSMGYGIDAKSVSTFNCNGTITDQVRFYTYPSENNSLDNQVREAAGFLIPAEIINAAKNGYVIETLGTITFDSTKGGCNVYNWLIHVQ